MENLQWTEDLNVGCEQIDEQHKILVAMINVLINSLEGIIAKEFLLVSLTGLEDYARVHFETEELYMKKFSYPEIEEQKIEHRNFIIKVAEFKKRFEDDELKLHEIVDFLKNWLVNHVKTCDKKMEILFVKEEGPAKEDENATEVENSSEDN
ncbi:bacteriohemerythrin [Candidatus Riflebacteria bacterium]